MVISIHGGGGGGGDKVGGVDILTVDPHVDRLFLVYLIIIRIDKVQ